jgi:hypothetical protein
MSLVKLSICVTEEQELAIRHFCLFHNWDWDEYIVQERCELETSENTSHEDIVDVDDGAESTQEVDVVPAQETVRTTTACDNNVPGPSGNDDDRLSREVHNECEHCLASPCVTQVTQSWFGKQHGPRAGNNTIRKQKYKLFWKMLDDRGLWKDNRYIRRKMRLLARDDPEQNIVWTPKEVMKKLYFEFCKRIISQSN